MKHATHARFLENMRENSSISTPQIDSIEQDHKQRNMLYLCTLVVFRAFTRKARVGKRKVFLKLKPTVEALGMTERMGRKIKYEE